MIWRKWPPISAPLHEGPPRPKRLADVAAAQRPDGEGPGGWNRIHRIVDDLAAEVARLKAEGVKFRNDIVTGPGGSQVLIVDPSGNFVELFQPKGGGERLRSKLLFGEFAEGVRNGARAAANGRAVVDRLRSEAMANPVDRAVEEESRGSGDSGEQVTCRKAISEHGTQKALPASETPFAGNETRRKHGPGRAPLVSP